MLPFNQNQNVWNQNNFGFQIINYGKLCLNLSPQRQHVVYIKLPTNLDYLLQEIKQLLPNEDLEKFRMFWIDSEVDKVDIYDERSYRTFLELDKRQYKKIYLENMKISNAKQSTSGIAATSNSPQIHDGITCDGCDADLMLGFRYKCIQCPDFDLCENCEFQKKHKNHVMIRLPTTLQNIPFNYGFLKNMQKLIHPGANGLWNIYSQLQRAGHYGGEEQENSSESDNDDNDTEDNNEKKNDLGKNKRNKKKNQMNKMTSNNIDDMTILNEKFTEMFSKSPNSSSTVISSNSINPKGTTQRKNVRIEQGIQTNSTPGISKNNSMLKKFFEDFHKENWEKTSLHVNLPSSGTKETGKKDKELLSDWAIIENGDDKNSGDADFSPKSTKSQISSDDSGLITENTSSLIATDDEIQMKLTLVMEEDYSIDVNSLGAALDEFRKRYKFSL